MEAFSDGVLAIIITIMVLELKVPHDASLSALGPLWSVFLSYVLSFVYIGIYWNNHHHLLHTVQKVTGGILWANLHLLFWLSVVPFVTGWMGENHFAAAPTAVYGGVLLMAAIAYWTLQRVIIQSQGEGSLLKQALRDDWKGNLSPAIYVVGIAAATTLPWVAGALYALVAVIWLVPDKRIERVLHGAVGAVAATILLGGTADAQAQDAQADAAIRAVVADQAAAWDAGDAPGYARHVAPEASFTNLFGMVMYGAPAFAARHVEILATFYKGTTKHHAIRRIRFVSPDVAIVDIDNEVRGVKAMPAGIVVPPDGIVRTQLMEVFVRRDGRWWIEAYHNVDVKPRN